MLTPRHGLAFLAITAGLLACSACASKLQEIRVLPPRGAAGPGVAAPAGPPAPPGAPDVNAAGLAVAHTAGTLLGLPYREGGALPDGFDCSGLVNYVFARHGIAVPRDVRRQALAGALVDPADIVAGDLVFFSTTGSGATHVGIAIGEGRFIHAPKSGDVVRVESMSAGYWTSRFVMARRIPIL
jgi:cell wall-associated NlpC family hydrolase